MVGSVLPQLVGQCLLNMSVEKLWILLELSTKNL
jgi:hypothetical protein